MVSMRVEKDHTNNTANKNVGMHANRRDEKRKRVQIENRKKIILARTEMYYVT
jgi:hypothetical protein